MIVSSQSSNLIDDLNVPCVARVLRPAAYVWFLYRRTVFVQDSKEKQDDILVVVLEGIFDGFAKLVSPFACGHAAVRLLELLDDGTYDFEMAARSS